MTDPISSSLLPVTLLTGFLGSGKTTLINYLLKHNHDEKVIIIENEFGPVNIDSSLLNVSTEIQIVEMTNGCICCTVQGELTEALHKLHTKRLTGELQFDRLIIETTGLADPAPIIQTFFIDDLIRETIQLDGIITLVDANHILKHLNEHPVTLSQIGFADRIILTKTDCISDQQKAEVINRIHKINHKATIFEAIKGQIPKSQWLDIHAFDLSDELTINKGFFVINPTKKLEVNFQPLPIQKQATLWGDNICSYLFEAGELDLKKIGNFMESLVEQYGNDMLRYKGVLAIKNNNQRLIVQGVHKIVGFDYGSPWQNLAERISRLVIISRTLPFDELNKSFLKTISDQ
ncbi:CobW family GTP-binding protein [Gilliamella sp. ESL0250]|uniref:CobW family GTP-binding protein n=1 Tax=Gilliamella sp. ESL0250 TaxID=2705036 RepID=UPI0015811BB4|nr:GTP-binding protein [Gilliamella sp. ESL0250]NUF50669.1 GTP-binding protein [Gilliamella sp. ESL0250]